MKWFWEQVLKYIGLPLILEIWKRLASWWDNKQAQIKIVDEVTKDIEAIIETETREEQRAALRKLTENIRNRMRN